MFTPIRTDRTGIDSNIYNICMGNVYMNYLLESAHISYIFLECVYDIINNMNFDDNYQYSGWCFDNKNYQCIKTSEKQHHPIYIKEINDITNDYIFSILDRLDRNISDTDGIYITKNIAHNNARNIGSLSHEFCHMIDMYVINKNTIKNEKYKSILDGTNINKIYLEKVKSYKYYLLPSEQRAFLHATIYELINFKKNNKSEYNKLLNNFHSKLNIIAKLIDITAKFNKIYDILQIITNLEDDYKYSQYYFAFILYFIYHENKQNNISLNDIINFHSLDNEYIKAIAEKMLKIVEKNKDQYHKKLQDAIYNHILFDYNE